MARSSQKIFGIKIPGIKISGIKIAGIWKSGILLSIVVLLLTVGVGGSAGFSAGPAMVSDERLAGYREQLEFIRSEIKSVQGDLEWLSGKIKDLEAFDRFVPPRMRESVEFKKSKIQSLKKLEARYEKLGRQHQDAVRKKAHRKAASALEKKIAKSVKDRGLEDWVVLKPEGKGVRLDNRLPILFSAASAEVSDGYGPFIQKLASLVKSYKARVVVKGYADTDPIRTEKYPSNFELGAARAGAVVRTFVSYGADPSAFQISSTGAHRPETDLKTDWKSLQRHVNISIYF